MAILTTWILPRAWDIFSIFLHHLQFPLSVLYFSAYRSFTSLVRFIPKFFFFFDVILKGIFTLPFWYFIVSAKKCNRFLQVNLYPILLPCWIHLSDLVILESLWFSIYSIMSSTYSDNFTYSLLLWVTFLFLTWLLWLGPPTLC